MDKSAKYAINTAFAFGIGNAIINLIKQLNRINENPSEKINWTEVLKASAKGAIVGGIGGFVVGSIKDYSNSIEEPLNTDILLLSVAKEFKLKKDDFNYLKLNEKSEVLINELKNKFKDKLNGDPLKHGSTEKGTALNDKFDIDIFLPFKPDSFSSTEEMYYSVHSFLEEFIGRNSISKVRKQKKSIGVILELRNDKFKIDVVPYKITKGNSTSGYLYINEKNFFQDNSSYTKTDIHAMKSIKLSDTQKEIVVLLKLWKNNNNIPISSFLIENLVLDAYKYNRNHIPKSFTKKTIMVINHIRENIDSMVLRSVENTNNILTNIPAESKNIIISECKEVIEEYEYQPNSIIEFIKSE